MIRRRRWPQAGMGFDVHRWSDDPERPLLLGGVSFPGERGLEGHSDADVVAHAAADAVLAAAGLGDIGTHFPDDDPVWRELSGAELLRRTAEVLRRARWQPVNVACTVVLDAPRLSPRRSEMAATLGEALGAPVSVSGKTSEGLGAIGRGEGVACWAVALVVRR